jgi:hypothetical protein
MTEAGDDRADAPLWTTSVRVLVALSVVFLLAGLTAMIAFVAGVISHRHGLVAAAFLALSVAMLSRAPIYVWRAHTLFTSGHWTRLDGKPASRADQPSMFKVRLSLEVLCAVAWGGGGLFLIRTVIERLV